MIRVRNLKKVYQTRFGENLVFEDLNFDLAMGERLGILGRNGAGKSTLVRLISGAERPTEGTIESDISISWPLAFSGAFQHQLTGIDNIRFISRIYDQDFDRNLAFVEEFAELGPYLREPVMTYSSGMRARLAFAISMIIEFECFLIDEVGAVGDARFHERCNFELFQKRGDRAMIIISHDASYIRDHCNRFAVLHDKRLTLFDEFDEAFSHYAKCVDLANSEPEGVAPTSFAKRSATLDSLRHLALADDRFRVEVHQGDWARDGGDWGKALAHYADALALHPYERSYWIQYGHAARESGNFPLAECAYRTSAACGEPLGEIAPFLAITLSAQGLSTTDHAAGAPDNGHVASQPPAYADLAVFAGMCWGAERIDPAEAAVLLRECRTLDLLAHRVLCDPRADDWLMRAVTALPESTEIVPESQQACHNWQALFWRLVRPATLAETSRHDVRIIQTLEQDGAFSDWPLAVGALARLKAVQ